MYRNCIFCSAEFGTNDVLESFPVGQRLAFDAWRGRLWAVCPRCARWNLSPIEERWEAVEAAEKLFRDARMRVQSENVGMARLPDGTRLIRVGQAVPGELAAWRYGTQLLQRRKRYLIATGASVAAVVGLYGGISAVSGGFLGFIGVSQWFQRHRAQKIVHRVSKLEDPDGRGLIIRRWHIDGMSLHPTSAERILEVQVRDAHREKPDERRRGLFSSRPVESGSGDIIALSGEPARALLSRAMIYVNKAGASRRSLEEANRILVDAGSATILLRDAASGGAALGKKAGDDLGVLEGPGALAFEMALNEESERRALEGELAALEAAWREAEEIAAIADALPGEAMLNRVLDKLAR